jgi:hypothetical protein
MINMKYAYAYRRRNKILTQYFMAEKESKVALLIEKYRFSL